MGAGGEGLSRIHNGDVYACDFFVDGDQCIGKLLKTPLRDVAYSEKMEKVALAKGDADQECWK
ncbi:MAG: hypothetical protein R6V19_02185 [Armatimonadota bacterium]